MEVQGALFLSGTRKESGDAVEFILIKAATSSRVLDSLKKI